MSERLIVYESWFMESIVIMLSDINIYAHRHCLACKEGEELRWYVGNVSKLSVIGVVSGKTNR